MDSLQETGNYITNKSEPLYAAKVKHQLNELKSNWATAVKQSNEQKEKLAKALSDAEKLDQDIKRLVTWMKHAKSGVEDDESTLQHADVTQERLDHYKVTYSDKHLSDCAVPCLLEYAKTGNFSSVSKFVDLILCFYKRST